MNRIKTKDISLLDIFSVEENQHFWWKCNDELYECYIDYDNHFYTTYGTQFENTYKMIPMDTETIRYGQFYYEKPFEFTPLTDVFLRTIRSEFNIVCKANKNDLVFINSNNKNDFFVLFNFEKHLNIDLSMLEENKEYVISELLGDD